MYISKTRFINWTRCPMYFARDLKHNPLKKTDIDAERERREEMLAELMNETGSSEGAEDEEEFDAKPSEELEALLPYYNQVEDEALKVAKRYFKGTFVADSKDVHKQKLFEYVQHGHTYRCYVDIFNENDDEINIIEVKATTNSKYLLKMNKDGKLDGYCFSEKRGAEKHPMFVREGNIWTLNHAGCKANADLEKNFEQKRRALLDRYSDLGKYPHDLAFQKYVIEHSLRNAGDNRKVNYYLAVLNSEYVYDGAKDADGKRVYNNIEGQELIVFLDMNETVEDYQPIIVKEIATLEGYFATPHDVNAKTPVGPWCDWGKNTKCVFCIHCFKKLRDVPDANRSNNYMNFRGFKAGAIGDKFQLINNGYYKFDDVPVEWLEKENHKIQRECYDNGIEHIDKEKMTAWFRYLGEGPIYHFDFESFPCPLPRFKGESPYQQSVFEFSLHIERAPGVCDKNSDNIIFLNEECDTDEREALVKAIVDNFEFNEDGSLHGIMLAQNTSFEIGRLNELAAIFPKYSKYLLAIADKTADLIHLLRTNLELYEAEFGKESAGTINYYHPYLSGSYSIKRTLPVLVPSLSYDEMKKHEVGNGVQAYITYLSYNEGPGKTRDMNTKKERREALCRYCQQDTWAMVEILRAVRKKIGL